MIKLNAKLPLYITILSVIIIGYIGYKVFKKFKMPAPGLTGSLFANAIVTAIGAKWSNIPTLFNLFLQIMIGIMVGSQFNKEKVKQIRKLAIPSVMLGMWMVLVGLGLGFLIAELTGIDIGTALFSAAPGGMSEMSFLAMMYNLNVPIVVLFQFLRIVLLYLSIPLIADKLYKRANKICEDRKYTEEIINTSNINSSKEYHIFITILIGFIGGFIAYSLDLPGGPIIGSLLAVGGCRSIGMKLKALPKKFIVATQIGLGASLGLTFTPEVAASLVNVAGLAILFSILIVLNSIVVGYLVHKIFKIDLITSLLACSSAGISQMSAIALDMDADAVIVSVMQSIRLISVVVILPPIIIALMG